jgi:hypothetical protein
MIEDPAHQQDQEECRDQHHQSHELVGEALGELAADVMVKQTLARNAHHVTEDRDRNGAERDDDLLLTAGGR